MLKNQKLLDNLNNRSNIIKEALYSTAVQFGQNSNILKNAFPNGSAHLTDMQFIIKLYNEKRKVNKYFTKLNPKEKDSVKNRFYEEEEYLLNLLDN